MPLTQLFTEWQVTSKGTTSLVKFIACFNLRSSKINSAIWVTSLVPFRKTHTKYLMGYDREYLKCIYRIGIFTQLWCHPLQNCLCIFQLCVFLLIPYRKNIWTCMDFHQIVTYTLENLKWTGIRNANLILTENIYCREPPAKGLRKYDGVRTV